jgi:tRNA A22 N-methylase
VGCDHGKLCVEGLLTGRLSRALCVDISPCSLDKARKLADEYGAGNIVFCVSDGLTADELQKYAKDGRLADVLVIAGVGGYNIIEILEKNKYTFGKYILVPHQDAPALRKYLMNNFHILIDFCVHERKFYDIIICGQGTSKLTQTEIELGKNEVKGDFYKKLIFLKGYYEDILKKHSNEVVTGKLNMVNRLLENEG